MSASASLLGHAGPEMEAAHWSNNEGPASGTVKKMKAENEDRGDCHALR